MTHILIVEDDADIREILTFNLESAGYEVVAAASAEDGLKAMTSDTALILLDVMLPGISGYQLAHKLRSDDHNEVPIIFLTARNSDNDILTGFSSGGDDYISKPFSINEVLARVKAVLKRSGKTSSEVVGVGPLTLSLSDNTISLEGVKMDLSRKEFDILALLIRHPDSYYSRGELLSELWKEAPYVLDRTVDVHIARIRSKLGAWHDILKNKTGFGYYLDSHYDLQK